MSSLMTPYLHFTSGDTLIFKTLTPSSTGAIAGACIGLVLLALLERWLAATRSALEAYWRNRALALVSIKPAEPKQPTSPTSTSTSEKCCEGESDIQQASKAASRVRIIAPFIFSHDLARGLIHATQALLTYLLMLAVMSFQAAFIISIVLGLGLGEILFGRMGVHNHH